MNPQTRTAVRNYILVGTVFALMAGAYLYISSQPKPDAHTLCHPEHTPQTHTIILIDKTDPIPPRAEQKLRSMILREKEALPQFDKLSIFQIVEHPVLAVTPVFSLCNPGSSETASPFYENPQYVQSFFEDNFEAPLNAALLEIQNVKPGKESPIMEAVQTVAKLDPSAPARPSRRLIIVSDMLQNVIGAYSHYTGADSFDAFRKRPYAQDVRADLAGTDVYINYISRYKAKRHQGAWHRAFWEAFFSAAGARQVSFRPFVTIAPSQHDDHPDDYPDEWNDD